MYIHYMCSMYCTTHSRIGSVNNYNYVYIYTVIQLVHISLVTTLTIGGLKHFNNMRKHTSDSISPVMEI